VLRSVFVLLCFWSVKHILQFTSIVTASVGDTLQVTWHGLRNQINFVKQLVK